MAKPTITSSQNAKIKQTLELRAKRKVRDKLNLMVIEGLRELQLAVRKQFSIEDMFVCETHLTAEGKNFLANAAASLSVTAVSKNVYDKLAMRENADGIVATAKQRFASATELKLPSAARIVYLHAVEKPGNIGAIFRSADAAGMQAVFLSPELCDPFNPNAIRASIGTVFAIPIIKLALDDFLVYCQKNNISPLITSPVGKKNIYACDLRKSIAVILGSEAKGLASKHLDLVENGITIPMCGLSDSLNVSVSAAIIFYEILRQRQS